MSNYSLSVYDDNSNLIWDSYTVPGGAIADIRIVPSGGSGTWTYPAFAGRNVICVNMDGGVMKDFLVTWDTNLGYPRMIANGGYYAQRKIMVIVI